MDINITSLDKNMLFQMQPWWTDLENFQVIYNQICGVFFDQEQGWTNVEFHKNSKQY